MKIRTNLFLLSATFVILAATIGFVMFNTFSRINREIEDSHNAHKIVQDVFELNIVTYEYLMRHQEKRVQQQWLLKYNSVGTLLKKIRKEVKHTEYIPMIELMTADHKLFGDLFLQLQVNFAKRKEQIEENKPQTGFTFYTVSEERQIAEVLMRSLSVTAEASKLSSKAEQRISTFQQKANLIIVLSIIGFVIFSSYISLLIIKIITGPINELIKGAEIIGKGDLEHKIDLRTKSEMRQLANSFNQMAADLKVSKDKIESHSKNLEKEVRKRTRELEKTKVGLEETVKRRTKELQERVSELERYHDATTDRELRMKELREEIERLKIQRPLEQKS